MGHPLTRVADYMIRCVLHLAGQEPDVFVTRRDLVKATGVPDALFRKLAQELRRLGIVEVTQGARGGYRLAVPAEELSLLQVIEAAGGRIALNACLVRPEVCGRTATCAIHEVLHTACEELRSKLDAVTFADLAERVAA